MEKYLITGGAGFIGSNIVKKVLDNGDLYALLIIFQPVGGKYRRIFRKSNFELIESDLTN
jgi:nucleoside-diphosphate-sugar epimerase